MMSVPALESGRVALAEDVARDAARGRRTAGNISREGRGFLAAFPKKRTGWTRRARAETTGASAIRGARARGSPNKDARSPGTALVRPSRSPRHPHCRASYLGHLLQLVCGCSDGIDFTERVRSGYPGSAHRRARTRPSGDVRGETASATTLDARGRRSRGAGFDPRVTPNAMTSPREPLHFSSRSSISTKWIRLSVRALPPRMGIQSRRARFGLPVRARLHSLAPKNANSGAYAQLVSPESKIGSRRISDLLADQ